MSRSFFSSFTLKCESMGVQLRTYTWKKKHINWTDSLSNVKWFRLAKWWCILMSHEFNYRSHGCWRQSEREKEHTRKKKQLNNLMIVSVFQWLAGTKNTKQKKNTLENCRCECETYSDITNRCLQSSTKWCVAYSWI